MLFKSHICGFIELHVCKCMSVVAVCYSMLYVHFLHVMITCTGLPHYNTTFGVHRNRPCYK